MKILLVEDEESKRRSVIDLIAERFRDVSVAEARSLNSALKQVTDASFDLVILDMTMPTFDIAFDEDGGRPQAYGGREIMRHMKRKGIVTPVVLLTQFDRFGQEPEQRTIDEIDVELRRDHTSNYMGAIRFNVAIDTWRDELMQAIESLKTN